MLVKPMHVLRVLLLLFLTLDTTVASRGDVDQFSFAGFAGANLTLDGGATVTPDGLLMLTNGTHQAKGHALHPAPFHFRHGGAVQSFLVAFVFCIVSELASVSGHGIAFFIAPSKDLSAALPSQYLGLLNSQDNGNPSNHLFAVELDTILNLEFKDINNNHVGIDINNLTSLRSHDAGYYDDDTCEFRTLNLISCKAMQVWVEYDGRTMELNVTLAPLKMPKPKKPLLSAAINLSAVITEPAYIGFSSSTGSDNSRHYILGWSFALNGAAPAIDYSKLPALPRAGPKPMLSVRVIAASVAAVVAVLAVVTAIVLYMWRRLKYAELREEWEVEYGPHRFSYKDLFHATGGFKKEWLLGVGGFGSVYKGVLPASKTEVAVKCVAHDSRQGMREFVAEVVSIGRLRQRNIVQLLGYCRRKGELLLVYDYMPNGSLDMHLHDRNRPALDWARRFQVVKGVAAGLLYLHEDWEQVVVHRDVKASNVLLDGEMNPRLGDFGLARLYDHGADPQTTCLAGTMGYMAPELLRTGKASPLTDVFAFGAFLLEVACGRRPIERDASDNRLVLVDWVLQHWRNGSVTDMVDPRLGGDYVVEEATLVLKLGLLCSHPSPHARPHMRQVMQYLNGDMPLPELSPTYLSFSMLALMQNEWFDSYVVSYPSTMASFGVTPNLSGGR